MTIHKKIVIDDKGKPSEVIIPYDEFKHIEEMLGLDLSDGEKKSLDEAMKYRQKNDFSAYIKEDDF
ncbi:MAG: hypothetical protein ACOCV8_03785 [Spirochaetota bacterium]